MSPQDVTNLLVGLRYDTCGKHDSCEPCKGLRQDSIGAIESLQQTVAELRAERDQMLCMLSKASDALRHSYNAVDWPADGTSRQEIVAGEIDTMLARLATPPAAEEPAKDQDIERHIKW